MVPITGDATNKSPEGLVTYKPCDEPAIRIISNKEGLPRGQTLLDEGKLGIESSFG